jgi:hypothetical protein
MQPNTIQLLRVHEDNGSAGTVAWTMAPAVITVMVVMVVVVVVVTVVVVVGGPRRGNTRPPPPQNELAGFERTAQRDGRG